MAFANSKSISIFLIIAISSLMMISAEEEIPSDAATTETRQSKQLFYVPQLTPASSYPVKYFSNRQYDLPLMMPKQSPLIRGNPLRQQQQVEELGWPYTSPFLSSPELKYDLEEEEEETPAAWRVHDGIDDYGNLKLWKKRFNRQAVITIHPAASECLTANLATEGLGPCKRASQSNHGTIDIKLPVADQAAVVAITANSPVNTRIRLICTELDSSTAGVFTQTGQIQSVADTPRTEVGYLQLVVTSTAANAVVKCFWQTYRHYTATYP